MSIHERVSEEDVRPSTTQKEISGGGDPGRKKISKTVEVNFERVSIKT